MSMDRTMCRECKKPTTVVHDQAAGDMVCMECGLVVEAYVIDDSSEWRTFANEANSSDPIRVGGPTDVLLSGAGLSTTLVGGKGEGEFGPKRSWAGQGSNPDRDLTTAFHALDQMGDRLDLFETVKGSAREMFAKFYEGSGQRGRINEAIYAACLYIACRQLEKPRTFKEIAAVCRTATKKDIGRAQKVIVKRLEEKMGVVGAVKPEDFMRRFCSHLNMERKNVDAAIEIAKNCESIDLRTSRAPISKAAAAIFMVTLLKGLPVPCLDIAKEMGVAETTIRNTYKDLVPFARQLIPSNFATEEEINRLSFL